MGFKGWVMGMLAICAVLAPSAGQARAATLEIVGLGDSLMAAYGLEKVQGFPARLEAELKARGFDVRIIDAGVSGDTTTGGLARLDWSVPEGIDAVILELGANDALRGISPENTRSNLNAMIVRLKERGVAVLLAGMLAPPNMGDPYEDAFNSIYPDLAEKYELVLYPFFLDGVTGNPDLQLADGMHPNVEGIEVMVERFVPTAVRFLSGLKGRTGAMD